MKNFNKLLFILLANIIFLSSAQAATYYVNSSIGNDSNTPVQARNISTPWLTVQFAIDNSAVLDGDNIVVAAGTYAGFTLTKRLNIIGAWKGGTSTVNTIFNSTVNLSAAGGSATSRMLLKNLRVASTANDAIDIYDSYITLENVFATTTQYDGLRFNSSTIKDVLIESCNFNNNGYAGIFVPTFVDIDGWVMRNSTANNNNYFGIAAFQSRTTTTEIKNVEISHCAFIDNNPTNQVQGHTIYFEKLKNSLFQNISVEMPSGNDWIGIDINLLSRTDYSNISILNSRVIRATHGSGIWIQARNDLFDPPAALDTVLLRGLIFTNCDTDIAFNRQVKRMTVDKCDLSTYSVYGLVNYTDQDGTIDASNNKWQTGVAPDTTVISGGLLTVGNNIISFMPSTDGIFIGMGIAGPGIPPGTTVIGKSPNTVSMSNPATISGFVPQIGFAYGFHTSTDIVRTSLNFIRTGNPLPFSIVNQANVSFPNLAAAITGTTNGGTIWNVPSGLIPGTTIINKPLKLIGPGAGFLDTASRTTFQTLSVSDLFTMGSDFAVADNYLLEGAGQVAIDNSGNVSPNGAAGVTVIGEDNTLIFNGSITPSTFFQGGNRSDMFFGGGAAPTTALTHVLNGLRTLQINRPSGISLSDSLRLHRLLFLQSGLLSIDGRNLILDPNTTIFAPNPTTSYVATNGLGELRKEFTPLTPTAFNYVIGNGAYSPFAVFFGSYTLAPGAYLSARVVNTKHPNDSCSTDYLNRYWVITPSGITGISADTKFTYVPADVVGTEANIVGARLNGSIWEVYGPVNTTTHSFVANNIHAFGDFTGGGAGCIGASNTVVNIKIILQGAYSSGTGLMRTDLLTHGIIPLTQPYAVSQFNYPGFESVPSIPAGVVDWVYLEIRTTPGGGAVLNGRRAAFVKSDGSVVDLDGLSPVKMPSVVPGNYYIVVGHRNHIPVMSATARPLSLTSIVYDFTIGGLGQYFGNDAANLGGGKFGMYAGDANRSFVVSAADYSVVTSNLLQTNYNQGDINMSAVVSAADYSLITSNLLKASNVPNYP